jgi:hypothetical protein
VARILREQRRLKVIGSAGTGKTWLALEHARLLARRPPAAPRRAHPRRPAGLAQIPACHLAGHRQPARPGLAHQRASSEPVSADFLDKHQLRGISPERIRPDRILQEVLVTGADPLHLALVFNIDHTNAMAYANAARNLLSSPAGQAPSPAPGRRVDSGRRSLRVSRPAT